MDQQKKTYVDRLDILKQEFKSSNSITNIKIIDARCNVSYLVTKLLHNTPSAVEKVNCKTSKCENLEKEIISPTLILKIKNFNDLQKPLDIYTTEKMYDCGSCFNPLHSIRVLMDHLFIEADYIPRKYKLFTINISNAITT